MNNFKNVSVSIHNPPPPGTKLVLWVSSFCAVPLCRNLTCCCSSPGRRRHRADRLVRGGEGGDGGQGSRQLDPDLLTERDRVGKRLQIFS